MEVKFDWKCPAVINTVDERVLSAFRRNTYVVVSCGIVFSMFFGIPGLLVAVVFLFGWFVPRREYEFRRLLENINNEVDTNIAAIENSFLTYYQNYRWKQMVDDTFGMGLRTYNYFLCRTCSECYSLNNVPSVCHGLSESFPHNPKAEPPNNNPFEWYWLKAHGYALPPANWPKNQPWLPLTATVSVDAMQLEGRYYYETHANSVWDNGFGHVPEWYKSMRTNTVA